LKNEQRKKYNKKCTGSAFFCYMKLDERICDKINALLERQPGTEKMCGDFRGGERKKPIPPAGKKVFYDKESRRGKYCSRCGRRCV